MAFEKLNKTIKVKYNFCKKLYSKIYTNTNSIEKTKPKKHNLIWLINFVFSAASRESSRVIKLQS